MKKQGTAYVARLGDAKDLIFTAGHNLWDNEGISRQITFFPGMPNKSANPEEYYGKFEAKMAKWSDKWNPALSNEEIGQYDFGIVQLKLNSKKKAVGDIVRPVPILYSLLVPSWWL